MAWYQQFVICDKIIVEKHFFFQINFLFSVNCSILKSAQNFSNGLPNNASSYEKHVFSMEIDFAKNIFQRTI